MLFAVCVFAANYAYNGAIARAVQQTAAPVLALGNIVTDVLPDTESKKTLEQENATLRAEVARLADVEVENKNLHDALVELRLLTDVSNPLTARTVAVPVIARAGVSIYGTLTVANDPDHPIVVGARVYGTDGIVIGVISQTSVSTAQVQLFSASGQTHQATVLSTDQSASLAFSLVGKGHGNFIAYVPRDADIPVGALVYTDTTGIDPIGIVAQTEANPTAAERTVRVHVPFVIESLRFVRVQTNL
jgi:cell shape-determining protein MreC